MTKLQEDVQYLLEAMEAAYFEEDHGWTKRLMRRLVREAVRECNKIGWLDAGVDEVCKRSDQIAKRLVP